MATNNSSNLPDVVKSGSAVVTFPSSTSTLATTDQHVGYYLYGYASIATPADSTTYYFGSIGYAGGTSAGFYRFRIPKAGTIKVVIIESYYSGTQPSSETSTVNFKVNGGSNVVVLNNTFYNNVNAQAFMNNSLSTAVAQGDYVEFNWVTPAWATNPGTSSLLKVHMYIE